MMPEKIESCATRSTGTVGSDKPRRGEKAITVLIADDDPLCRILLEATLRKSGHSVLVARDGDEAWQHLQATSEPLVAILDWNMPGLDGLELCSRIRKMEQDRFVYVMLLTGLTGREAVIQGLEAGAHDFITKPFDQDELYARLRVGERVLTLQQALADRVHQLQDALNRVRQLQGLLPICCYCKSIRNDKDYWQQVEHYISDHADVRFSHGICPKCYKEVVEPQLAAAHKQIDSHSCTGDDRFRQEKL